MLKDKDLQVTNTLAEAIEEGDSQAIAQAMINRANEQKLEVLKEVRNLFEELKDEQDEKILNSRGVFKLTKEETEFYNKMFNAVGNNPTEGGTLTIPKTIVNRVFEDLQNVPNTILNDIDFENTTGASEWLVSVSQKPVTTWGDLCDPITKELQVGFKVVTTLNNKLSCFVPYCKSLLDLGAEWQDAYVRKYIALGLALELTKSAISGNGTKAPWGMAYDYTIDTDSGVLKTPVKLKEFTPKALAPVLAKIAKDSFGLPRVLTGLTMYVDSETYYTHVYPYDLVQINTGCFVSTLANLGITVKQVDTGLTKGQAVLGLPKRYFMECGFKSQNGLIEFSDHQFFVEDKRVYKGKVYADGFAKDKTSFVLLDLTTMGTSVAV